MKRILFFEKILTGFHVFMPIIFHGDPLDKREGWKIALSAQHFADYQIYHSIAVWDVGTIKNETKSVVT